MEGLFFTNGFETGGILNLTPHQAQAWCMKGCVLIDVREDYMNRFKMFDVAEVIYCPYSILKETYQNLPEDKPMICADTAGLHSKEAVKFLIDKGFGDHIANLAGGLVEWERDGLPIIIDRNEQLSGSCMCQLRLRKTK